MCDVLILDDEEVVRTVLVDLLEDQGFAVLAVGCPQKALDIALLPDGCTLLLTDIDLGVRETDGFDVARQVRQRHPNMPVLFISGRPWKLEEHNATENDRLLAKPFRMSALLGAVQQLMARVEVV
jgi:CheY-like chemotaxis protein